MSERFQRFDPQNMDPDEYLGVEFLQPENYDLRAVSVLAGAFNPLIETFVETVRPQLGSEFFDSLELSGEEPTYYEYARSSLYKRNKYDIYPNMDLISFQISLISRQYSGRATGSLFCPVGEYGDAFARANIQTGRALYGLLEDTMIPESERANDQYEHVIQDETFQKDAFLTLREGVQTIAGMLAILTAETVEGFDDPLVLSRQIVDDGIMNFFAANSANGQVQPMIMSAFHFDHPIIVDEGTLKVRPEVAKGVIAERKQFQARRQIGARGRGCPVAHKTITIGDSEDTNHKDSGVSLLSGLYVDVLSHYAGKENGRDTPKTIRGYDSLSMLMLDTDR